MNEPNSNELDLLREGKTYVAGHRGMVGSAIVRRLEQAGCKNLLLKSRAELDLTEPAAVRSFMQQEMPDYVFLAAAKVGGIHANNTYPAEFIHDNLMIAANVIDASHRAGSRRLLFLGSSCIYPRLAPQPMQEESLLSGALEPTNEPYAIAKIAGIKLCESYNRQYLTDFRSVMPTNLYGQNDNFDLETSHVLPALIRKFHEATISGSASVEIWGTGKPKREFLHVDDLADASVHVMCLSREQYASVTEPMLSHLNIGAGEDITIRELADLIREIVGFHGEITFNTEYPDGAPRKLMDVSKMSSLGWQAKISLRQGIALTYDGFREMSIVNGQTER
jgi:GDP-L-fucose synthase